MNTHRITNSNIINKNIINKKIFFILRSVLFAILPGLIYLPFYFMREKIFKISDNFSPCLIREKYGILCPGCGNTHCIKAILSLHFIKAIEYNLTIPLFLGIFLFYYYAWVLKITGVPVKQVVKREHVAIAALVVLIIYYFARNII